MKKLFFALLVLSTFSIGCSGPEMQTTMTNLTEAQVLQIVTQGSEKGKNYIITKNEHNLFDVLEVERFPEH
ncbi:MAG TPA: hypothetical protein PKD70_11210 [Saprospiraceae bacterium]|nr:hypothetical protein [Saprospiraceae bacterium]HMP14440.1 hypothetical protein [Saprospiraceae bacterium]